MAPYEMIHSAWIKRDRRHRINRTTFNIVSAVALATGLIYFFDADVIRAIFFALLASYGQLAILTDRQ